MVRMGGGQPVGVDVRFICSSSADLENLVAQGAFLEDLYNRITVFPIALPPLRERPEDILPLADMFLKASAEALGRTVERISTPAQELLLQYPWPGNAGELAQCMKLAVQGCDDLVLRAAHLPQSLRRLGTAGRRCRSTMRWRASNRNCSLTPCNMRMAICCRPPAICR